MLKRAVIIFFVLLFSYNGIPAKADPLIEIFHINEGKVVKTLPSNPSIQKIAENYLSNITGIYPKFDPVPDKGYGIRIPLNPPVELKSKFSSARIDTVIIMIPEEEASPFLMIFETENKLLCFTFKGSPDKLFKALNFKPVR